MTQVRERRFSTDFKIDFGRISYEVIHKKMEEEAKYT